ncbi:MAG TPA: sugar ABC transporter permease [Jiangellales bacterium]|nr:sugar ABC transporter permease [Jiangellales bacterium]
MTSHATVPGSTRRAGHGTPDANPGRGSGPSSCGRRRSPYPLWFLLPAAVIFSVLFLAPTLSSFYFSLTRWSLFDIEFIGLENFTTFFGQPYLYQSLIHTFIYAALTSGAKVVLGLLLGVLLTSPIVGRGYLRNVVFFPVLVSTVGVGLTFAVLLNPSEGLVNEALGFVGIDGPGWLTDPDLALISVALVDIWRGVGIATLIYIAGIVAIPPDYYEAARVDGATPFRTFWHITLPLSWPATTTVIILSLIGGLRSFDLIWTMTRGGPGFTSDVLASVVFKQYQAGFYGLSTAGNVVLFVLIVVIILPLTWFLNRREVER